MKERLSRRDRYQERLREVGLWITPGLGVKRWFLFVLAGITLLGVGLAIFLLDLYRTDSTNPILLEVLSFASLRFLPRVVRVCSAQRARRSATAGSTETGAAPAAPN